MDWIMKTKPGNQASKGAAVARLSAYAAVVAVVATCLAARSARAAMRESSMALGRELEQLGDLAGTTKAVSLNGQRMFVSTAVTPLGVPAVLDRFEAECVAHPNALARSAEEAIGRAPAKVLRALDLRARLSIARSGDATEGVVACLWGHGETKSATAVVREVATGWDMASLGDLVFVHARVTEGGVTHVVTTHTEGSFKPFAMFPESGDVPGTDSAIAPRPSDARRVLSAVSEDAPYAIRSYTVDRPAARALADVDAAMGERGWTALERQDAPAEGHAFMHTSGVVVYALARHAEAGTVLTFVEQGQGGAR
jgi:hypothetical protein